jgi:UDP-glucose 4-epimerase
MDDAKKILVTGGAGFIGSHLVDALVAGGHRVAVLDDLSSGRVENLAGVKDRIEFIQGDINDAKKLREGARGCDTIFHLAAVASVQESLVKPLDTERVNTLGTLSVLEAARLCRVRRVVLASSSAIYGDGGPLPKREDMAPEPTSPYAVQKYTGELYARLYAVHHGVETVCLRFFNVYGPRQVFSSPYSGVISIFIAKALSDESAVIYGDGRQTRDFIFVADVVRANLLAMESRHADGIVINVATGMETTINRLWETIRLIAGIDIEAEYAAVRPGDIIASVAAVDSAADKLNFKPEYPLKKGLEKTFTWYKEN